MAADDHHDDRGPDSHDRAHDHAGHDHAGHNHAGHDHSEHDHVGPGYATPQAAIEGSTPEQVAYVVGLYTGSDVDAPDFIGVVDVDPESETYLEVIDRVEMPTRGDELHHFGWNACSSSCHVEGLARRYLVVPGNRSSRIHVIDTEDRRHPELASVIEPAEVHAHDLSGPHTVHCVPDGKMVLSMTGDADGELPGGFLELDDDFQVVGRWEPSEQIEFNYDFWYQPRHDVMVSSEWAAPSTYQPGFDLEDVEAGKYGRRLHFWNWSDREVVQTVDLGEEGLIPLEVRFLHTPEHVHGYVNAALSSNIFHFFEEDGEYRAEKVIDFEPGEHEAWDMPVPALPTDVLVSMDDRYLFGSNWLHGDVWMYDISDPANPRKADSLSVGGYFGDRREIQGRELVAGP